MRRNDKATQNFVLERSLDVRENVKITIKSSEPGGQAKTLVRNKEDVIVAVQSSKLKKKTVRPISQINLIKVDQRHHAPTN